MAKLYTSQQVQQYQPITKEIYGYGFAESFGLKVPTFGLIELGHDFVSTLSLTERARLEQTAPGWKFAVEWIDNAKLVDLEHLGRKIFHEYEASLVYAYDHIVWNGDRKLGKPNLLATENELILIDHEMCFCMTGDLHLQKWRNEKQWGYPSEQHLFFPMLKAKRWDSKQGMFDEFEEYMRSFNLLSVTKLANFLEENRVMDRSYLQILEQLRTLKADSTRFRTWLIQTLA